MRIVFFILFSLYSFYTLQSQSVLTDGNWYRVGVSESGMYKIDRNFLAGLGIDVASLDPKTLKLYGSGFKGMLPQSNSVPRSFDPEEYAIYAVGQGDGSMDAGDYFLFYGNSPHKLGLDSLGKAAYEYNLYSDTTYFLITYGGDEGKRISSAAVVPTSANPITSFTELIVQEEDGFNLERIGRRWFSNGFSALTRQTKQYAFQRAGMKGPLSIEAVVAATSENPCSFDVLINNTNLGKVPVEAVTLDQYENQAKGGVASFSTSTAGPNLTVGFRFNPSGTNTSIGYIDHFILSLEREMRIYDNQTIFHLPSGSATYQVAGAEMASQVWDVTDIAHVKKVPTEVAGNGVRFGVSSDRSLELVAFKGADFPAPRYFGKVPNQNLKAHAGVDGIIVSHPLFLQQATRLAQFHQSNSGLSVAVVTPQQIYNEYSGGAQDISALRDFFKHCYDTRGKLKYVTLFGDASYDYKRRLEKNTNFVPVYEARNSFHPIFGYSSDDFYAFLEDDEGYWEEGYQNGESYHVNDFVEHTMDIGVGRLPVKSAEEAEAVVNKIIRYKTSNKTLGKWRNRVAYFTDDGDGAQHMDQAERLYDILDAEHSEYSAQKIHLDAYEQEEKPPYQNSSKTQEVLLSTLEDGVLILNYLGHGSERRLTDEYVVTLSFINNLKNRQKLPFIVTATCDFGKYDDPGVVSGGELFLLNENSGAIALLTTTRPVFSSTNLKVNTAFHKHVFKRINGELPRLGDVQRATKNGSLGDGPVNRNFALLGDAMVRLNYPQYELKFDQFETGQDTLSALETYHLSGSVMDGNALVSSFEGKGIVTLWDMPQEKVTKGDENAPFRYMEQDNLLYQGEISVRAGKFSLDFLLPKNISYKYQQGKLTMYAWNEGELIDASGASRNFVLGGTAPDITPDNTPPAVRLFINDSSFTSGGTVGTSSLFIANLSDHSGINISRNGFNQSITLTLNDGEPVEINKFYTASKDDYTKGVVLYPLLNLEPGNYTATLKVCDTHNNPTTSTVEFKVSDQPIIRLYNAKIYPNPATSFEKTTVSFEHDREGEELLVNIRVYNMMGREVYNRDLQIDNSPRKVDNVEWLVRNDQGGDLEKGVYIYRLNVTSTQDGAYNEVIKRLVIIN